MPTPLRVAVVSRRVMPLHGVGGLERAVRDQVRHLADRGVDVTLITPPPVTRRYEQADDPFAAPNIRVRHVPYLTFPLANRRGTTILDRSTAYPLFGYRAGRLALSLVNDGQIDIVHGHGASVLGYALARPPARAPLVFNPHGMEEFGSTGVLPWPKRAAYGPLRVAVRRVARAADCIISTDEALLPMVLAHLKAPADRVRTLPNGIDLRDATSLAGPTEGAIIRRRHDIDPDQFVFLSAGRIERNKGFDLMADALGRLASRHERQSWRWVVVGAGPERPALERQVHQLGLTRRTVFAGRVSDADLHAWYEAASVFVHPSRYEGSSLVTLEAMAHRAAIVASRAGGLPDKVRPGENGWLVEPGEVEALVDALSDALSDLRRLVAMGERSRQIVETEFAWSVLIDRQIDLYRELLAR